MREMTLNSQTTCVLVWQNGERFAKTFPTNLEARPRHLLYSLRHRRICRWSNRSIVSPSWTETALAASSALLPVPPASLPAPPALLLPALQAPLRPPSAPLPAPVAFLVPTLFRRMCILVTVEAVPLVILESSVAGGGRERTSPERRVVGLMEAQTSNPPHSDVALVSSSWMYGLARGQ